MLSTTTKKHGFTLVELLVVMAVIGMLIALLIPAVQPAREAGRRTSCMNHLKQLALAALLHEEAQLAYPPARMAPRPGEVSCGESSATWMVRILPYLEQNGTYTNWDLGRPWYQHTDEARNPPIPIFLCPSRRTAEEGNTSRSVNETTTKYFLVEAKTNIIPIVVEKAPEIRKRGP